MDITTESGTLSIQSETEKFFWEILNYEVQKEVRYIECWTERKEGTLWNGSKEIKWVHEPSESCLPVTLLFYTVGEYALYVVAVVGVGIFDDIKKWGGVSGITRYVKTEVLLDIPLEDIPIASERAKRKVCEEMLAIVQQARTQKAA